MAPQTQPYHRTTRRWLALTVVSTTVLAFTASAGAALAKQDDEEWVTICHRTNATKNPYVVITVKRSAVDGVNGKGEGQGDHYGQHTGPVWAAGMPNGGEWGDIIPPVPGAHDGLNWDERGQAIFAAGCDVAAVAVVDATDTDGDGTPDTKDPDDNNDGTPDIKDPSHDSDRDGNPDTTDPDDDNDGTPDIKDPDVDGDGTPNLSDPDADPDGDGDPNLSDPDDNGDGTPDAQEPDRDDDGNPDYTDPDDDNDGNPDTTDPDDNNDGELDNSSDPDSDQDGKKDSVDSDDDNDTTPDVKDSDSNGDGIKETEPQVVVDPLVPDRIKPGKEVRFGEPDYTEAGMEVTYRVSCVPIRVSRVTPRGDADTGGKTPLCVVDRQGGTVKVRVISADPVKVRVVASSGAVATYEGYRKVYVYSVS